MFIITSVRWRLLGFSLCALLGWSLWRMTPTAHSQPAPNSEQVRAAFGRMPLWFEANRGQAAARDVQFLARSRNAVLGLTADSARLQIGTAPENRATVELKFRHAQRSTALRGLEALPGRSHYLLGNVPQRWQRDVPQFARVEYDELYPGIDLVFYGRGQTLEYDLLVAPHADPRRIEFEFKGFEFKGAQSVRVNERGDLVLSLPCGDVIQKAPVAYQLTAQGRELVAVRYALDQRGRVRFVLGEYDRRQTLVIDPVIEYSNLLAGTNDIQGPAVAVDGGGNVYLAGYTGSPTFPGPSPIQASFGGIADAFVVKLNPSGTTVLFATFLGGGSFDSAQALALDASGNVYVTGVTISTDFPVTTNAAQRQPGGQSVGGQSDGFISKISSNGTELSYSTYWGGNAGDSLYGIAVDAGGNALVAGVTQSNNLPNVSLSGALFSQSTNQGANWTATQNGLSSAQIEVIASDAANGNRLYAATFNGLYKTENKGTNWTRTGLTVPLEALALDPKNALILYAGFARNIYKSTDGGASYTTYFLGQAGASGLLNSLTVDPVNSQTVYAATRTGVLKTTDGGATWTRLNLYPFNPPPQEQPYVSEVIIAPNNPAILYAATSDGVYKSVNSGAAWTRMPVRLPSVSPSSYGVRSLVIDAKNPQTFYALVSPSVAPLLKSTDGGVTWQASGNGLSYALNGTTRPLIMNKLVIDLAASTLYATPYSGGLFRSADGGATWTQARNGLNSLFVTSLHVDQAGTAYAGTLPGGDAVVARLNSQGTAFTAVRLLGGGEYDEARGLKLDHAGNAVVAGFSYSYNFPTRNPLQATNRGHSDFQPTSDAFVARLNPLTLETLASTYYGGALDDYVTDLAVDAAGNAYLVGGTYSENLPTTPGSFQSSWQSGWSSGERDNSVFIAKLNAAGTALGFATFLNGSGEEYPGGIAVDASGYVYVTGQTVSPDFPVVNALPQPERTRFGSSLRDAFVSKFSPNGASLLFSTLLGGTGEEYQGAVAIDAQRNIYLTGSSVSPDFPTLNAVLPQGAGGFLMKLAPRADLAVMSAAQHNPVMASQPYRYTVTVTNRGADEAREVVLSERVPANLTNVTITSSAGANACTGAPNLQCRLGELAAGATATVTIAGTAPATGTIEQSASVASATTDADPTNNRATLATTISASPSLAGRVVLADGTPLAGVTLNLTVGAMAVRQSNATGAYQFTELVRNGSYTVAAQRAGYAVRPPTVNVPNVQTDQVANFTATLCAFTVTTNQTAFPASGGNATLTITANDALCVWQARSNTSWITINAASGTGNGALNFTVAATTQSRSGTVTIGGRTLTVTQENAACATPNFRLAQSVPLVRAGGEMQEGDFNGDQITDLAFFDYLEGGAVMLGNGTTNTNGFGARQPVELGLAVNETIPAMGVGDVNGDGRSDLVFHSVAGLNGANKGLITVLANANGTFGAPRRTALTVGNTFSTLVLTTLNGDNRADLIAYGNNGLTNYLSNGDGTFTATNTTTQAFNGSNFAPGDFNGDGRTDVVVGNFNAVAFFAGDGAGGWQTPIEFTSNIGPVRGATAADFNRDGKLDFAICGPSSLQTPAPNQLLVYFGDGAGRFAAPLRYAVGVSASTLAARDFNQDGWPDLAVVNQGNGVSLFLNNAGSGLRPPLHYSAGLASASLVVSDIDRDNHLDLILQSPGFAGATLSGQLLILKGNGLDFQAGRSTLFLTRYLSLATGDFNNDGRLDTIQLVEETAGGLQAQALAVRRVEGLQFVGEIRTTGLTAQLDVTARDFNQDGKLDAVTRDANTISLWAGDGAGRFQLATRINAIEPSPNNPNASIPIPLAFADFNRDGRDDFVSLASVGNAQRQPALYLSQNATYQTPRGFGAGLNLTEFHAGDFNGDGYADVLALPTLAYQCQDASANAVIFFGDGQGNLSAPRRLTLPGMSRPLFADDLNGDGRTDLAVAGGCDASTKLTLLFGNANGDFTAAGSFNLPNFVSLIAAGDLNNDGRKDLALSIFGDLNGSLSPSLHTLTQRANGTFDAPVLLGPTEGGVMSIGDFTGDGLNDLFGVSSSRSNLFSDITNWLTLFPNNCQTTRALAAASAASYSAAALAPDSIVAVFGTGLATVTAPARTNPLPLELNGTRVIVTDGTALERPARLFFVSPAQVNLLLPAGLLAGTAQIKIISGDSTVSIGSVNIAAIAPGLFTANADGRGVAAALALRVRVDGLQRYEPLAQLDTQTNRFVPLPLDFGLESDQLFLVLYGTGWRGRTSLANVTARVGGADVPVLYAGSQNDLAGLDQINLALPRTLKGRGEVDVQLTIDGQALNVVRVALR